MLSVAPHACVPTREPERAGLLSLQDEASAHAARVHEAQQGVEAASAQASCSAQARSDVSWSTQELHRSVRDSGSII